MMAKLHSLDWEAIRDSLATIGAPTTADDLGIDGETLVEALVKAGAIKPERYTIARAGLSLNPPCIRIHLS